MLKFEDIEKAAMKQLKEEYTELLESFNDDPVNEPLVESIMKLRGLSNDARFTLAEVLCENRLSFLDDFRHVLNRSESLRLVDALSSLLTHLFYNILDDGYLRLFRLEEVEEFCAGGKQICRTEVYYFLSTDERLRRDVAVDNFISHHGLPYKPKLVSAKTIYFGTMEEFKKFIDILTVPGNWDGFTLKTNDIDREFCFYEAEELIREPVSKEEELNKRRESN